MPSSMYTTTKNLPDMCVKNIGCCCFAFAAASQLYVAIFCILLELLTKFQKSLEKKKLKLCTCFMLCMVLHGYSSRELLEKSQKVKIFCFHLQLWVLLLLLLAD